MATSRIAVNPEVQTVSVDGIVRIRAAQVLCVIALILRDEESRITKEDLGERLRAVFRETYGPKKVMRLIFEFRHYVLEPLGIMEWLSAGRGYLLISPEEANVRTRPPASPPSAPADQVKASEKKVLIPDVPPVGEDGAPWNPEREEFALQMTDRWWPPQIIANSLGHDITVEEVVAKVFHQLKKGEVLRGMEPPLCVQQHRERVQKNEDGCFFIYEYPGHPDTRFFCERQNKTGGRFCPRHSATRPKVALARQRLSQDKTVAPDTEGEDELEEEPEHSD